MTQEQSYEPTINELSKKTGISIERIIQILQVANPEQLSLETQLTKDNDVYPIDNNKEYEDIYLGDIIEDKKTTSPEKDSIYQLLKEKINNALLDLSDRNAQIIRLRFGLGTEYSRSREEVRKMYNISPLRIIRTRNRDLERYLED